MLARAHRLIKPSDFRHVLRRGEKHISQHLACFVLTSQSPSRFGFVVSRKVGNAPQRNLLKRRLRAASQKFTTKIQADVVVRVLPHEEIPSWTTISKELSDCLAAYASPTNEPPSSPAPGNSAPGNSTPSQSTQSKPAQNSDKTAEAHDG